MSTITVINGETSTSISPITSCDDDNLSNFSISSSENDDDCFAFDAAGTPNNPTWQERHPAQFSMPQSNSHNAIPGDLQDYDNRAIYRETNVLDAPANDDKSTWIRLLQIKPDVPDHAIRCRLVRRPLWDAGPYYALSYSWGKEPRSSEIYIESKNLSKSPFRVSHHLWSCLKRLRDERGSKNVWIDAICIDQHNIVERAAQVHVMAQIFDQASEVRVWLGEQENLELQKTVTDRELLCSLCQQPAPWWTRLWILQECAYANACPIIMLGPHLISFESLIERWQSAIGFSHGPDNFEQDKILKTNLELLRTPFDAWNMRNKNNIHRLPLSRRLRETAGRQCTESHDRIYALLSLIDEEEERQLKPDYRKPIMELLLQVSEVLKPYLQNDERGYHDAFEVFDLEWYEEIALSHGKLALDYSNALMEASQRGDQRIIQILAKKCAESNADQHCINDALKLTSAGGHEKTVQILIDTGANLNAQGGMHNSSALQLASENGHEEVVQMLLDAGADVNAQGGRYNSNALYVASEGGYEEVVQMLIKAGAHINTPGGYYNHSLQAASARGYERIVQVLLCAGANANAQGAGPYGNALRAASARGNREIMEMLLGAGADFDA